MQLCDGRGVSQLLPSSHRTRFPSLMTKHFFLVLGAIAFAAQAHAIELARYPQVFATAKGVEVTILPTADEKQALLKITGVNHVVDNVVFLADAAPRSRDSVAYTVTFNGVAYTPVIKMPTYGGERYAFYLPGATAESRLSYDEQRSKSADPAEIQALYEKQAAQGVQTRLARFDREKRLEVLRKQLEETDASAAKACGAPIKTTVEWDTVSDKDLRELNVSSYCGTPAEEMARLCNEAPRFQVRSSRLAKVQCRFGDDMKIRIENGQTVFLTTREAPNQGSFVRTFLLNQ
jgi:hypothetical protein